MDIRLLVLDIADAFSGLKRRPLRSLLSSLGIGIGVTALIAMLSISEGAKQKALAKIASLGTDTLRVEDSTSTALLQKQSLANLSFGITLGDVAQLRAWLGDRGAVGSYARKDDVVVTSGGKSTAVTVLGVSWEWFRAEKLSMLWGRPFDGYDQQTSKSYCVVGSTAADDLGLTQGEVLKTGSYACTAIGALLPRGSLLTEGTGLSALDFDRTVVMPITAMPYGRLDAGKRIFDGMVITVNDAQEDIIVAYAAHIRQQLLKNHRQVEDFRLVVPVNLLKEARESQRLFSLVMGAIAGLSLLVGGIGVMNVMLANISEQTREIGLRMALGACRARIVWYYLWNSMLLTFSGAVWGIVGGVFAAYVIQSYAGWEVAFSSPALFIAPLAALLTGLLFGLHPAIRAASLDPAIALRES